MCRFTCTYKRSTLKWIKNCVLLQLATDNSVTCIGASISNQSMLLSTFKTMPCCCIIEVHTSCAMMVLSICGISAYNVSRIAKNPFFPIGSIRFSREILLGLCDGDFAVCFFHDQTYGKKLWSSAYLQQKIKKNQL